MTRRLRQCYLGPSPQQMLSIVRFPRRRNPEHRGTCFISILPDEVLGEILAYLPPRTDLYSEPEYEDCPPISLVCKHWERVYDATLYRRIRFVEYPAWQTRRTSKVVKILQQQADLRKHVRDVSVEIWHPSEATCRTIANFIESCQATRTVSLHLGWSATVWPIIEAIEMLPRLESLRLSGYDSGPSLQMILGRFNKQTLKVVELFRYGLGRNDSPRAPWHPVEPPSQDAIDTCSLLARSHATAMTSVDLRDPSTSPQCTETFLRWPLTLVRLSLSQLTHSAYWSQYTLDAVETILSIHRESLQHIMVGIIPRKCTEGDPYRWSGIPNFSKFRRLRELHLSAYNLLAEKPSEAAVKLAAPVLRQLAMTFCTEDQHSESSLDFREDEVLWMADFASQISNAETKSNLEGVFVDFNPDWETSSLYSNKHMPWPWEHVEEAKQKLSQWNINMTHSKPGCTRDEWDQRVMENRRAEEARIGLLRIDRCLESRESIGAAEDV